jgi:hypothetical protein
MAAGGRQQSGWVKDLSEWGPTVPNRRPIKEWLEDAHLWTELQMERGQNSYTCCLNIQRSLVGEARKIATRVPEAIRRDGGVADLEDGLGAVQREGVHILLHVLKRKYDQMDIIRQEEAQLAYDKVKRRPGQSLDSFLNEFELNRDEAQEGGAIVMSIKGHVRKLLNAAGYPRDSWMDLFRENQGAISRYGSTIRRLAPTCERTCYANDRLRPWTGKRRPLHD